MASDGLDPIGQAIGHPNGVAECYVRNVTRRNERAIKTKSKFCSS